MNKAKFFMTYMTTGETEIELPDSIDVNNAEAVKQYVLDNWANVPLPPYPKYISDSDRLDETQPIKITTEKENIP